MIIKLVSRNTPKLFKSILILLFTSSLIFCGNTGKVSGIVTDMNTGEALIAVNIFIDGTDYGTTTNLDGKFSFIGLSPGKYSITFSYIGYQTVTITDVAVIIDRTTSLNVEMNSSIVELDKEIVVKAVRSPIAMDVSSSKRDIDIAELEDVPLLSFNNLINLQPGAIFQTRTNDVQEQITPELSIRGGTGVGVYVDGLNVTEALSSGSLTNFNMSSLKVAEILSGGFNAEYGNIRSGIINVVTKDGGENYNFSIDLKVSPPARKHFGPSIYDQNLSPEWILYGHDDALYGADGVHDMENPDSYWEYWSLYDTTYGFTPEQAQRYWKYQHRGMSYGHKPDFIVDASFGGPVPLVNHFLDNNALTFFTSLRYEYNMLAIPLSRDHFEDLNWFWKLTFNPGNAMKLNVQGTYQQNFSSTTYNTPQVSVTTPEQAIFAMQYWRTKYYKGMKSLADRYRNQIALNFTHAPTENTYYDFKVSYLLRRSFVNHADYLSDETTITIGDFSFDATPNGFVDQARYLDFGGRESDFGLSSDGLAFLFGGYGIERDYSRETLINTRFDLVSQLNQYNQIKTGFEFNYNDLDMHHGLIRKSPPLQKMDTFRRIPIKAALYIQDKIEFVGLIANIGARLDYTNRRGTYYTDMFSDYFNKDSLYIVPTSDVKPFLYVSPRIGISHPISEKSKLFFNYGHFYDEPGVLYLYNKRERYGGLYDRIENSNLKPQRTIAYELGFNQQIGNEYLFHLSGYYRNITNQIMWVDYYSELGNKISSYSNGNYADIRGLEVIFEKKFGRFFLGSLSYDYMVTSSGNHGNAVYYEDYLKTPLEASSSQSTPGAAYTFLANISFKTPQDWEGKILGIDWVGDWMINFTYEYRSGRTFTYNPQNLPGINHNLRWRPHMNTNMRITKGFKIGDLYIQAYLDVYNLFNRKELNPQLRSFLLPNLKLYYDYLESLELEEDGGNDQPGDYKADHIRLPDEFDFPTQLLFKPPRDIYFGIKINY